MKKRFDPLCAPSPVITIRSFRNTDVPSICEIWNSHHSDLPPQAEMNPIRLEVCSLAKPYFDPKQFLLAEVDDKPCGLLHYGAVEHASSERIEDVAIHALCVKPQQGDSEVAAALVAEFRKRSESTSTTVRPMLPDCSYYLGFGPADYLASVTVEEFRLCKWLAESGFSPSKPTCLWELELAFFQAPIDRNQIQIRRSTDVQQEENPCNMPWEQAILLGHLEQISSSLHRKSDPTLLGSALFWTMNSDLRDEPQSLAWWWPGFEAASTEKTDVAGLQPDGALDSNYATFLLSESMRKLAESGVSQVRVASHVEDQELADLLHRLGFAPARSGMLFADADS